MITIEVPQDSVGQLHPLRLSFIVHNGDRAFYDVDLCPVGLHVVDR
jgi:hypothetical protein